jgi:hypothetical protein
MLDPVTALAVLAGWLLIAIALGCLVGKVISFGTDPERVGPYDREGDQ